MYQNKKKEERENKKRTIDRGNDDRWFVSPKETGNRSISNEVTAVLYHEIGATRNAPRNDFYRENDLYVYHAVNRNNVIYRNVKERKQSERG